MSPTRPTITDNRILFKEKWTRAHATLMKVEQVKPKLRPLAGLTNSRANRSDVQ